MIKEILKLIGLIAFPFVIIGLFSLMFKMVESITNYNIGGNFETIVLLAIGFICVTLSGLVGLTPFLEKK